MKKIKWMKDTEKARKKYCKEVLQHVPKRDYSDPVWDE